jgi:pimeloyl-ACP methyl ester carboxylesterase
VTARAERERCTLAGLSAQRWRPSSPTGASVLLLHGAMDRGDSFARTARRLGGCDVVALDRRGYGGSAGLGPVDVAGHAVDVCAVLDQLGGGWLVVGHSIGGTVALAAAATGHPGVLGVATFESPAPWLEPGSSAQVGGGALEVAADEGPEAAAEHFFRLMVGDGAWDRLGEPFRSARRAEGPALVAELADLASGRELVDLAAVEVPVAVGLGAARGGLYRQGLLLAAALPSSSTVVLDGAPHGVHLTSPDAFAAFVGKVGAWR